eukprot:m.149316 g.149316  ORF g.149316 m.149316 type:complete len:533 (-) comp17344_c0_seq2:163-1761(-)
MAASAVSAVVDAVKERPLLALGLTNAATGTVVLYLMARSQGGVVHVLKNALFSTLKNVPGIQGAIDSEQQAVVDKVKASMFAEKGYGEPLFALPREGRDADELLKEMEGWAKRESVHWKDAKVTGAVYHGGEELQATLSKALSLFLLSNPLHPEQFPCVRKLESEVIRMGVTLFHGNAEACGSLTSGGTESIFCGVKTHRDYYRTTKGIVAPEMVLPRSAHPAFLKAAHYLKVKVTIIDEDPDTRKVYVDKVKAAINSNTVLIVGSAFSYPYGAIDDIAALGQIALKADVGLHVDACLGGFVLAFMPQAGFEIPDFDFKVPGVTSMSADTHKYGFTPKGSSLIMYRNTELRRAQYYVFPDWPGGVYCTPTFSGSRPGCLIAGAWAAMMVHGEEGYVREIKAIVNTTRAMAAGVEGIPELKLNTKPIGSMLSFTSATSKVNIYHVNDGMKERGWTLSSLQFPPSICLCVTRMHTSFEDKFVADLTASVADARDHPERFAEGSAAVYGTAAKIPDRSLVNDLTRRVVDCFYEVA